MSAFKGLADGFFQGEEIEGVFTGEHPKVVKVFHAGVEAAQLDHGLPFFCDERFLGVTLDLC